MKLGVQEGRRMVKVRNEIPSKIIVDISPVLYFAVLRKCVSKHLLTGVSESEKIAHFVRIPCQTLQTSVKTCCLGRQQVLVQPVSVRCCLDRVQSECAVNASDTKCVVERTFHVLVILIEDMLRKTDNQLSALTVQ